MPDSWGSKYTPETCPHPLQRERRNKGDLDTVVPSSCAYRVKPGRFRMASLRDVPHLTLVCRCIPSSDKVLGQRACLLSVSSGPPPTLLARGNLHAIRMFSALSATAGDPVTHPRGGSAQPSLPEAYSDRLLFQGLLVSPSPLAHKTGVIVRILQWRALTLR